MRTITAVLFSLILVLFTGCQKQDQSVRQSAESKSEAAIPKTDLHAAVLTDDFESIRQHIKAGSDINMLESSRASTPLITAAFPGKTKAAKMLIDAGADLNYQNADGSTALHTAAVFGKTETAKILIDAGIDLKIQNNDGSTALHSAAFFGRTEIVKALLEKGADKTLENKWGSTTLETVEGSFEDMKAVYDAAGAALKPLGLVLDYKQIKAARPVIAEMLKN